MKSLQDQPILWLKVSAPNTFHWTPHGLCKFSHELHEFFWVFISSSKLHDFYANSLSNSMEICKLRSELHETRPKKSVLILMRKIRCFLKSLWFWTFFSSQLEAPQELTDDVKKRGVLSFFSIFKWKLPENVLFNSKAPTVWHKIFAKWTHANYRSCRFKDSCSQNFKT